MRWAEQTLESLLDRVAGAERDLGTRWPLYADPISGAWSTTARGSWTGGFWAGLLWLRAAATGAPSDRAAASRRTGMLRPWIGADTATRGLIFWYGTCFGDGDAAALRAEAADACLAAHDPGLGVLPWGEAFGGPRELARVDGLPGLPRLLLSTGAEGDRAARAHLDVQVGLTAATPDLVPAWRHEAGRWTAHPAPPAGWSRTVGWLLLAVAEGSPAQIRRCLDHPVVAARLAAGADPVPPAGPPVQDASGTGAPVPPDTSAAAIEAVAALKLAERVGGDEGGRLRERGVAVLRALAGRYVRHGRLIGGCYELERGIATGHELVWGDFFLAVGLAVLCGSVAVADF
ncbi:sugar ABC transporter permease [Actinomadura sp. WMMB 499]|uniref:sugar ABC transporter permease n=1 Tax=Actinomadura sp. WMMB 499 TaxID=1219491 RepID=UPI001245D404|nr:sugar ABC transporter permease [Actinomadura sp. WMMB 499]QFG22286.1 sugar ABC transporter permease [Actinomadura sp. WMMB 499]